ncbi:carbon-nitrogen hydrolase family protein [Roseiconus lacunae]|uniref:Carbon-nitrogen hydrolase family protein n=1 Tax=Roseiconus lacunae TaxID=2605694 RepID=A0ABT7PJ13_9BACT|nr:carbon-nitrogen hydrolase family protein [Roseiconus lacunae]MDM4016485.1 carbon-nitrogen hydrolase family protein [Roseiconus lacunae]
MLIACAQTDIEFAAVDRNVSRVCQWLEKAAQIDVVDSKQTGRNLGADLVIFPECMLTGYVYETRDSAFKNALTLDSPQLRKVSQTCQACQLLAVIGFIERKDDQIFNACALIGGQGVLACYRKVHLPHLGIDRFADRGTQSYEPVEASTARGSQFKLGMAICYDGSFSEPSRCLALNGADLVALPTNWPLEGQQVAEIVPRARSHENNLFFAAANRVGCENGTVFSGQSSICGPDGIVLTAADATSEILIWAEIDIEQARTKRIERVPGAHVIDRFADRQPEYYGRIMRR